MYILLQTRKDAYHNDQHVHDKDSGTSHVKTQQDYCANTYVCYTGVDCDASILIFFYYIWHLIMEIILMFLNVYL